MQNLVEMDGASPALPAETLGRVRAARQNHNFWFVSAMDANQKRQLKAVTPLLVAVPDVKNLLAQIAAVKSIDFAMNVQAGSSSVRLAFICEDSAAATRLAKDGSTIFNKYFKGLGAVWLTAQLAGKSEELRAAVKELIDAVKFSTQGSSAEVSATISGKTADVLTRESGGNIRGPMLE
jgi:hypothetical protein